MCIPLPPLRSRQRDIVIFSNHFLKKYNQSMLKNLTGFAPGTMELLKQYTWPGNIRELQNVIERAVVLASGEEITPDLLPHLSEKKSDEEIEIGMPLDEALTQFKKRYISETLESMEHNQTKTADLLKIQRTYLNRLIKELGVKFK